MEKKAKKQPTMKGKIIKTVISAILVVAMVAAIVAANSVLTDNNRMVNNMMGTSDSKLDNSKAKTDGLDLEYNKSDYSKDEIGEAEDELALRIAKEGVVLLKNENNVLPMQNDATFSLFGRNSTAVKTNNGMMGMLGVGVDLKTAFEEKGMTVNETLWDFYNSGKGSSYVLGTGSVAFGQDEDFAINECPLSVLQEDASVLESAQGTTPIFVMKRVAGEGRDMPRSMYNHTDIAEDKTKSYLEPDSVELEILQYLNDNFSNVILLVHSNAAIELGWVDEFPSITSVILAPDGLSALPGILTGEINPSGRTVDTFARDVLASPAAQNFGDYAYYNEDGTATKYNYVSYAEGIYVGYKYYETRYEDVVLGQGNAGDYDYGTEVVYPFGYGLSYTTFDWGLPDVSWNGKECSVSVEVTNTGSVAGQDVVEIYAQSPYTDYDKENGIEKAAVQLVGYGKTGELAAGESEKVTVTFNEEQLKAYDANGAKTFILDAGEYFITAAKNAHDAVNNVLAAKGKTAADGMTAEGNADMVVSYVPDITETDVEAYSKDSYSGVEITNQFDDAKGDFTYLTRSDWTGTFPQHDGEAMSEISTWGNEINGTDADGNPAAYVFGKTISKEDLAKLDAFESGSPVDPESFDDEIVYGKRNGLTLIEMRGLDFDDPKWDDLLDQLTAEEYYDAIGISGYGIAYIDSINMPFCMDADTANGLIYGGTGKFYPNSMTLAQTWNQELAREYGVMLGNEAILGGTDGWYAPSMNIHRTPCSGRNGEYFSEDGFLSGAVASNEVLGIASKGVYAYIKHFAFNDQENHRGDTEGQFSIATWLNEQSAREIYLLPFEMCMKAGDVELNYLEAKDDGSYENATRDIRACQAVMTGFNRIGYTWTGGSYNLITGIVRNEWDFDGLIITDNANTGVFMDCYQMIESGADVKLTSQPESARFDFDKNNKAHYHYAREAMHRMLYTIANSKAVLGAMPGSEFIDDATMTDKVTKWVNIGCGLGIAVLVLLTILRFWPRKKKED